MFLRLGVLLAGVFLQAPLALSQTTEVVCLADYSWMDNSKGQNPCLVAAWLYTPCYLLKDSQVSPLTNGTIYGSPHTSTAATSCLCNTVVYSLLAACAACQGHGLAIRDWPTHAAFCTGPDVGGYPNPIPGGTAVPAWAYQDLLANGTFNIDAAKTYAATNPPESTALPKDTGPTDSGTAHSGTTGGGPTVSGTTDKADPTDEGMKASAPPPNPTHTETVTFTAESPSQTSDQNNGDKDNSKNSGNTSSASKGSNKVPLIGGLIGGAVVLIVAISLLRLFCLRTRDKSPPSSPVAAYGPSAHDDFEPAFFRKAPVTTGEFAPLPVYDPDDPRTFPTSSNMGGSVYSHGVSQNSSGYAGNNAAFRRRPEL